jgi:hypothetical protein
MVGHLIEYLRAALPKMRENSSTVGQEIELARAYLNILKMRMGERLSFAIEAPAELLSLPFPPLMLPSLVENAIKHGLEPQREGGNITISVSRNGDGALQMDVIDTGRGLTNKGPAVGGGVGLSNIRERLVGLFGAGAYLKLEANAEKGVRSQIVIPESALMAKSAIGDGANNASKAAKIGLLQSYSGASETPAEPQTGWRGALSKTWRIAGKAHGAWARFLRATFVVLLVLLGLCTVAFVIAVGTGAYPFTMGYQQFSGFGGMAMAAVAGVAVFIVCALVLGLLMVLLYGTGVFGVLTIVFLLLTTVFSALTPLVPLAVVGIIIYWIIKRGKTKA